MHAAFGPAVPRLFVCTTRITRESVWMLRICSVSWEQTCVSPFAFFFLTGTLVPPPFHRPFLLELQLFKPNFFSSPFFSKLFYLVVQTTDRTEAKVKGKRGGWLISSSFEHSNPQLVFCETSPFSSLLVPFRSFIFLFSSFFSGAILHCRVVDGVCVHLDFDFLVRGEEAGLEETLKSTGKKGVSRIYHRKACIRLIINNHCSKKEELAGRVFDGRWRTTTVS